MTTLNLGCGNTPVSGATNHDRIKLADHVDVVWDLDQRPWPWDDRSFDHIIATNVIEHLWDFIATMNECWRILKPGGIADVRVPRWDSINVHIDPTHRRGYHPANFEYLDPSTEWGGKAHWYTPYKWTLVDMDATAGNGQAIQVRLQVTKS